MRGENFQKNLGKGMILLGWIMLLGLLTLYFTKYLDKQRNPNQNLVLRQSEDYREVQLQRNRYGHYVATGMINDNSVVFMLDTGATDISIPQNLANKLDLKRGNKIPVHTANGKINVYRTNLEKVSLGDITLYHVSANINPFMHGREILLGMSFLGQLDFSQKGDQLLIRQY